MYARRGLVLETRRFHAARVRFGQVGVDLECLREVGDGGIVILERLMRPSAVMVCLRVIGPAAEELRECCDGAGEVAFQVVGDAAVEVRGPKRRRVADRLIVRRDRLIVLPFRGISQAAVVVGAGIVRLLRQDHIEVADRQVVPSEFAVSDPAQKASRA